MAITRKNNSPARMTAWVSIGSSFGSSFTRYIVDPIVRSGKWWLAVFERRVTPYARSGDPVHLVGSRDWHSPRRRYAQVALRWHVPLPRLDSIRTRLVVLALLATAPLVVLAAINASEDLRVAR